MPTCNELGGEERKKLLKGIDPNNERFWLMKKEEEDTDGLVLCAVESKIGDKAGGGVRVVRLHAPMQVGLRETITDKRFQMLQSAGTHNWGDIVDDLVDLEDMALNDGPVLHTLRMRYHHGPDVIFTAVGDVLLAVNPFRPVACCEEKALHDLMRMDINDLPPHIVKVARMAYAGMVEDCSAHAILVSGESGAGKTETAKIALRSIAIASSSSGAAIDAAMASSPLLEAFGNATTIHNKNSSRFGKWLTVYFDEKARVAACHVRHFILEQIRVVAPPPAERNYHVFYFMLHGHGKEYGGDPNAYEYTKKRKRLDGGKDTTPANTPDDDVRMWRELLENMAMAGMSTAHVKDVMKLLAAVLNLGQVSFAERSAGSQKGGSDQAKLADPKTLETAASLMQIDPKPLQSALTTRLITINGEQVTMEHTAAQANDARDALAKAAYTELFSWVVKQVNAALSADKGGVELDDDRTIGLLDIFGFENFRMNGFEQLCINLTNERLQSIFMETLIKRQLAEYKREGIDYQDIKYPDNSAQLALLDGAKGSVMAMLDEECRTPSGTEEALVAKMHAQLDKSPFYSPPKRGAGAQGAQLDDARYDKLQFVITHYAGPVRYTAVDWLEKNRGNLRADLRKVVASSSCPLVSALFPPDPFETPADSGPGSSKKQWTLGAAFRADLRSLAAAILQSTPHFIRCLKPNPDQAAGRYDGYYVIKQLQYAGVRSVVEINLSGYPISNLHDVFKRRYRCIGFTEPAKIADTVPTGEACKNLLMIAEAQMVKGLERDAKRKAAQAKAAGKPAAVAPVVAPGWVSNKESQIGKTKVFMRGAVRRELENQRTKAFARAARFVQRCARKRIETRVFLFLEPQPEFIETARKAIAERNPDPAVDALDELALMWAKDALPAGLHPRLKATRIEIDDLEMDLRALQAGLAAEAMALVELQRATQAAGVMASQRDAFITMKTAVVNARAVSKGYVDELKAKILEAEAVLEGKFSALVAEWEREASAQAAAKEEQRRVKQAEYERQLRKDDQMELLTIDFRVGSKDGKEGAPDVSEPSPADGVGMKLACYGVHFNDENAVVRIESSSANALRMHDGSEQRLRVGDVVLEVGGASLDGKRAVGFLNNAIAQDKAEAAQMGFPAPPRVRVVVARPNYKALDADALPTGEHSGWLYAALAADKGQKSLGTGRASRFWGALQADGLVLVAPRDEAAAAGLGEISTDPKKEAAKAGKDGKKKPAVEVVSKAEAGSGQRTVKLFGSANAKAYMTKSVQLGKGGDKLSLPTVAQDLVDRKLYPFRVYWADGETDGVELICAAASTNERNGWVKVLNKAIKTYRHEGGTSGWLLKRGGRRGGGLFNPDTGFKRRWFTLPPRGDEDDPHSRIVQYAESAGDAPLKGTLHLNRFTTMLRLPNEYPDQPHTFTITTQEVGAKGEMKPVTTIIAAETEAALENWTAALEDAVRGCVYAAEGLATRTPQMREDEAVLMGKSAQELINLLSYLNVPSNGVTDKGVLAARIVAARLHAIAGTGGIGAGAMAAKEKKSKEALKKRAEKVRREELRLQERSVEELHDLLLFLGATDVDPTIEDKKKLVEMIVGQKKIAHMAGQHAVALHSWKIRSSGVEGSSRQSRAISLTDR